MSFRGTSDYLGWLRFDRDSLGVPFMVISIKWDSLAVRRYYSAVWVDTTWKFSASSVTSGTNLPEFAVHRAGGARELVNVGVMNPNTFEQWLLLTRVSPSDFGPPDSIFDAGGQSTEYAAAVSDRRRWAIRSEQRPPEEAFHVRVFYSDTFRTWREVSRLGVDEDHCTVAPLGDTTALVVYAGQSGLQYAILDGARWTETGNLDRRPFNAAHPRLRIRPSGGLWLFWADNDWMHMSTYRDGVWSRGDSLRCIPNPGETFRPTFLDAEHDTTEYPVIAWTNSGYGSTWRDVTAIAIPDSDGWHGAEEIADSELSGWLPPTVTRDLNGDVWLCWRRAAEGINRWVHTYTSATCLAPAVVPLGGGARVTWTLSSRAPQSRWTLFRGSETGALDSLATVRAADDSVLTYADETATPGSTWRYAVRRECVDVRYRWTSDTTSYSRADDCTVTCAAPTVVARGAAARVTWALPAAAPDTRWTVLRARGETAFDSLTSIAAGADTVFAFDDSTATAGVLWRYAVRRGCNYSHEGWTSGATAFWRPDTATPLTLAVTSPTGGTLAFRVAGAAGFVWAKLYDLQGRVVLQRRLVASGTGTDSFTLDLEGSGARRPGVFFLRVADQTGRTARTARVAVVR